MCGIEIVPATNTFLMMAILKTGFNSNPFCWNFCPSIIISNNSVIEKSQKNVFQRIFQFFGCFVYKIKWHTIAKIDTKV